MLMIEPPVSPVAGRRLVAFLALGDIPRIAPYPARAAGTWKTWIPTAVHLTVKISPGELLDKLTILEIKAARIEDPAKRENVRRELDSLRSEWAAAPPPSPEVRELVAELKTINTALWEIEDGIRLKES